MTKNSVPIKPAIEEAMTHDPIDYTEQQGMVIAPGRSHKEKRGYVLYRHEERPVAEKFVEKIRIFGASI